MKTLKCGLLIVLLSPCYGQQSNTVLQTALSNVHTTPTLSPNLRNVGQSFHQLVVRFNDFNGVCSIGAPPGVLVYLDAGNDGINYVPIAVVSATVDSSYTPGSSFIRQANGAFAYIRVRVILLPPNCAITALYSGSLYGSVDPTLGIQTLAVDAIAPGATENVNTQTGTNMSDIALYNITVDNTANATMARLAIKCVNPTPGHNYNVFIPAGAVYSNRGDPLIACGGGTLQFVSDVANVGNLNFSISFKNKPSI